MFRGDTRLGVVLMLLLATLVASSSAVAGQRTLSNGEIGALALEQLIGRMGRALPEQGNERRLALRPELAHDLDQSFQDGLAALLVERGFDVWILEPGEEPVEDALLLDYSVDEAEFLYPRSKRGFLALGSSRVEREVSLAISGRLEDPASGEFLWSGSPRVRYSDWVKASELESLGRDNPDWAPAEIRLAATSNATGSAGWKERFVLVGLLGGVVLLYVVGAN